MWRRILGATLVLVAFLALAGAVHAQTAPTFKLGFAALAALIPDVVGTPIEDEHYSANGDSLQHATKGLMAWRKSDNWTAFTNGYMTWINGPNGVQSRLNSERFPWEADYQTAQMSNGVLAS